jgi:hypothetical protein
MTVSWLKTKRTTVCRLRQKNDRRRTVRDTCRDLVTYFVWKQVGLEFFSLAQNWRRSNDEWCTWHHRGDHVKMKSKTDESMQWAASDSTPTLTFS